MARKAGQIVARGARTWLVRVYIGRVPETQKRLYHGKTIHGTRFDAQEFLNHALVERDRHRSIMPTKIVVRGYCERWLETAVKPRVRSKTRTDYKGLLSRHVFPLIGDRLLAKLQPLDVQSVCCSMHSQSLSARTIRYTHAVLHSALAQAVKWRLIIDNPASKVELPAGRRQELKVFTPEQAQVFVKACADEPFGTLLTLAVTTGLRPSEYLALQWKDIDWAIGTVRIQRTLERLPGGAWQSADTKRPGSRRVVKLQATVLRQLERHREEASRTCPCDPGSLVFVNSQGLPISRRSLVQHQFKPLLRRLGLPDIRLYDLRHTAATLALVAGVPPKVVSEQLGHTRAAFTLDVYAHVLPQMQDAAAAKVEALLFGTVA